MNYWRYKIYRSGFGGDRVFVAEYLAETSGQALDADLRAPDGHVKSYLKTFFGVDADEYVREHRIRAEALLGGLIANMDCTLRFGVWIPLEAPAAMSTSSPTVAEPPVRSEAGVKLWVLTTGNTAPE